MDWASAGRPWDRERMVDFTRAKMLAPQNLTTKVSW
jgi:hypothetical protein